MTVKATPGALSRAAVDGVRQAVEGDFPGLWPLVEAGLSTCATLLLSDNANPAALIYVGTSSGSKTTVVELFADHDLTYVSDAFTPAAFVSQASNIAADQFAGIDLLPRIRHRVLITPELAPMFRGRDDELLDRFKIITRVLDGQGLQTDKATHGRRGYRGDYLFAWIGATTPIEDRVFRIMEQLGSRLFFHEVPSEPVTVDQLVASTEEEPYRARLQRCKEMVHWFLTYLFTTYGGVRGVAWETVPEDRALREMIARWATAVSAMRSEPAREAGAEYTPARTEQPWRANAVLYNLARGHALICGRKHLTLGDLPLVARIAVSSMPSAGTKVFRALVESGSELTVAQVQKVLGVRHLDTARRVMADLDRRGVMAFLESGPGKAAVLRFREKWAWCGSAESRALLAHEPVTDGTVCDPDQLIKSPGMCRSMSVEVPPAHTAQKVTGGGSAQTPKKMTGGRPGQFEGDLGGEASAHIHERAVSTAPLAKPELSTRAIRGASVLRTDLSTHVDKHEREGRRALPAPSPGRRLPPGPRAWLRRGRSA